MPEKIVVIGANHAGTAALNTILDYYPEKEVIGFDANSNISFLGCGMALWIGGQISGPDGLFYSNKEILEQKGASIHLETNVTDIDFVQKKISAETSEGNFFEQPYDKLILATGSLPVKFPIEGINLKNVQFAKSYENAKEIIEKLKNPDIKRISIIGAGYIGVELAEAFQRNGRNVTLIDSAASCLTNYYDDIFTDRMEKNLRDHNVQLVFHETVKQLEGTDYVTAVITDQNSYPTDMVIFCTGFHPNTKLGKDSILKFPNGAYLVNRRQQTSIEDVYAIGDCATVFNNALHRIDYIALATNAVRSGIIAAHNACGKIMDSPGVQGSNGISIWNLKMFSTGLSLKKAEYMGYNACVVDYEDYQKANFMKQNNHKVSIRIVYNRKSRIILGAQLCSEYDISMGIHLFSLAIQERLTIDQLKLLDLFFLPHFNQPYNYITMAALRAE